MLSNFNNREKENTIIIKSKDKSIEDLHPQSLLATGEQQHEQHTVLFCKSGQRDGLEESHLHPFEIDWKECFDMKRRRLTLILNSMGR
jgi:hypothetical protein